jgi:polyvinyl alcohol dehydrogenase (cytochrome)
LSRPLALAAALLAFALLLPVGAAPRRPPVPALTPLPVLGDTDQLALNPGLADDDWPSYGHDPWGQHFNAAEHTLTAANAANLTLKWHSDTGFQYGSVAVWQGHVVVLNVQGDVVSLNEQTGQREWTTHLGRTATSTPAVANGVVYVTDLGPGARLHALDALTGAPLWDVPLASVASGWGSPVVAGGLVVVGQSGGDDGVSPPHAGSVQAFDAATGHLVWRTFTTSGGHAGGPVWTTPVVLGGLVVVGTGNSFDGVPDAGNTAILAFDLAHGDKVWDAHYPDAGDEDFGASPQVFLSDGKPVVGESQKLHYRVVDPASGAELWNVAYPFPSWVIGTPAVADGRIYSAGGDSSWWGSTRAFTLDVKDGRTLWTAPTLAAGSLSASAVAGGVAYEPEEAGVLHAYDVATGAQLWSAPLPGWTYSGAVVANGMLFQGTANGVAAYGLP